MGQSYLLGCPEGGEQRLLEAVEKVDTAMCKIRDAGKVKARDRIAVLAALNLAFDVAERSRHAARRRRPAWPAADRNGHSNGNGNGARRARSAAGATAAAARPARWATTAA